MWRRSRPFLFLVESSQPETKKSWEVRGNPSSLTYSTCIKLGPGLLAARTPLSGQTTNMSGVRDYRQSCSAFILLVWCLTFVFEFCSRTAVFRSGLTRQASGHAHTGRTRCVLERPSRTSSASVTSLALRWTHSIPRSIWTSSHVRHPPKIHSDCYRVSLTCQKCRGSQHKRQGLASARRGRLFKDIRRAVCKGFSVCRRLFCGQGQLGTVYAQHCT